MAATLRRRNEPQTIPRAEIASRKDVESEANMVTEVIGALYTVL